MTVRELLARVPHCLLKGDTDREVTGICMKTSDVKAGDAYICIKGARFDAHDKVAEIAAADPAVIVVSEEWAASHDVSAYDTAIVAVQSTRAAKAQIAAAWYGHPADQMTVIGITGSKGKTTTAHMIASILQEAGFETGTIGTNGAIIKGKVNELVNTTPDSEEMQMYLAEMVKAGCTHAVVECSSQGLMQHRCDAIDFKYGIFTNIERGDHVGPNEHTSFENYLFCKGLLLKHSRTAVVNRDNAHVDALLSDVDTPVIFYGHEKNDRKPDYCMEPAEHIKLGTQPGIRFTVSGPVSGEFCVNMPGDFNADNALAAIVVCHELGISDEVIRDALTHISIRGRLEMVYRTPELSICVDFAHNGYSTRNLLIALREYEPKRLICIFGADGNRAYTRRTLMGEASGQLADLSIITSGHNRWETFEEILKGIKEGIDPTGGKYIVEPNRQKAIRDAITNAQDGDLITIIGLGHESYQEEGGVKYPYSDREFALQVLKECGRI